jgi:hypothetical protein
MPLTISHALSMTTPNDSAYENQPKHWNSNHAVTLSISATEISGLFSNKNGVSFGLDGTNITGSVAAGVPSPVNFSAGTTSSDLGSVVFSNSNGVSFGLSGSTITGTVATNYQSQGAYLTTAMLSNRGSDFVQATAVFAGTSASGTIASSGISVSIGPYITTGALSGDTSKYVQNWKLTGNTSGTTSSAQGTDLWFQGGNSITVSGSSNSVVFSVGNYLTTAMASNRGTDFVQATAAFAGTNASGTINSTGISVSVAAPGGGTTINSYEPYPFQNTGTAAAGFETNTSASQSLLPFQVLVPVAAEYVQLAVSMSFVTGGASSFRQSGTWHWGLFTRPTGTNSTRLSGGTTGSLSFALTYNNSTISISQATSTNSTGYGYLQTSSAGLNITSGYTGMKIFNLYLGATLTPGYYWFGIHHRNSSSSFNSGLVYSLYGNANTMTGMAPMGSFSSNYVSGTNLPLQIGGNWQMAGAYSVAGLTQLTTDVTLSQMSQNRSFIPYMMFESRV